MTNKEFIVVLDFDGTVVKHRYPAVGDEIGATPVLKRLVSNGHKIILNTMRSRNNEGMDMLQPAVDWFSERGFLFSESMKIRLSMSGHHPPRYMAISILTMPRWERRLFRMLMTSILTGRWRQPICTAPASCPRMTLQSCLATSNRIAMSQLYPLTHSIPARHL